MHNSALSYFQEFWYPPWKAYLWSNVTYTGSITCIHLSLQMILAIKNFHFGRIFLRLHSKISENLFQKIKFAVTSVRSSEQELLSEIQAGLEEDALVSITDCSTQATSWLFDWLLTAQVYGASISYLLNGGRNIDLLLKVFWRLANKWW